MTGGISIAGKLPEMPRADWISEKAWGEICRLSDLEGFKDFYRTFYHPESLFQFKEIYDSPLPHTISLPTKIKADFNLFHKLMILRTLRPDKLIPAV